MKNPSYSPVTPAVLDELAQICGEANVIFGNKKTLQKYSRDQIPEQRYAHLPEVVVRPKTTGEIAKIMKLANREIIPVTPRAAGSGLSGGAVPVYGGILLSIERMNRIIEIDDQNLMAVVEPGVITNRLAEALKEYGLFFAGYPMSDEFCFIGGNVAENAGGGRAVKYGVTGRYIHGLEVVTPSGDVIELGGKRIKDVTGYNSGNFYQNFDKTAATAFGAPGDSGSV
jgi:glycolate oxidase